MSDPLSGLRAVWASLDALPDDAVLAALSPAQRREAHDLGVRIQDRLLATLSELSRGMADDGADLVDERGLPRQLIAP